jgi:hypothetical protein
VFAHQNKKFVASQRFGYVRVREGRSGKPALSSDYWAYINSGDLYSGGLYLGGLIFRGGLIFGGGAYIWNEVISVSTCGGLIHRGG